VKEFSDAETAIPVFSNESAVNDVEGFPSDDAAAATASTISAPTTAPATTSASAAQEEPAALLPSSQIPALLQSETLQPPPVADESAVPSTPGGEDVVALPEYLPEERK
jgi:hypothetical protein